MSKSFSEIFRYYAGYSIRKHWDYDQYPNADVETVVDRFINEMDNVELIDMIDTALEEWKKQ